MKENNNTVIIFIRSIKNLKQSFNTKNKKLYKRKNLKY